MKILINFFIWTTVIVTAFSCSDIFEEQIDDEQVSIIAPGDSTTSKVYGVTFWWNSIESAVKYNLQIVSPKFSNIEVVVLDTNVTNTKFIYSLEPGTYQWRIKAINGSSETPYTTRTLLVDTLSLNNQSLYLISPNDKDYSKTSSVTFSWQSLFGSTAYKIEIDTITGTFASGMTLNQSTPYTDLTYNFAKDGRYKWQVKATNSTEASKYSSSREIIIDTKAPSAVTLKSPSSGTFSKPVPLVWDPSTSDDISKYRLYAYKAVGTDTAAFAKLLEYPRDIPSGTSFSFTDGTVGDKIVWRVTAIDKAGNESAYSIYKGFTIGF